MSQHAIVKLNLETDQNLSVAEWDRIVRRVLQSARLTRMPAGVRVHSTQISAPN